MSFQVSSCLCAFGFGSSGSDDKVLLKDVNVITLRHGKMTTGRRRAIGFIRRLFLVFHMTLTRDFPRRCNSAAVVK